MANNPSRKENINLHTGIYESPVLVDSVDQTYSTINKDQVVQDITQAKQSNFVFDGHEYAKMIIHPQNTCTNNKQCMFIVTILVLFVLDGLLIAFVVFNRASHEILAAEVRMETKNQLAMQNITLMEMKKLLEYINNWRNATEHILGTYSHASDCKELLNIQSKNVSGIYTVRPFDSPTIQVYCDMETDRGGWTVFQNRFDGSVDFYRNFTQYETGFGLMTGEFWLGLQTLYAMTKGKINVLRIDLMDANGTTAYETYQNFSLSPSPGYNLRIGAIEKKTTPRNDGTSMDYYNGMEFSTFDNDRDTYSDNCASTRHGAWWYTGCTHNNLNGQYLIPGTDGYYNAMYYFNFRDFASLKMSKMMYRRQ